MLKEAAHMDMVHAKEDSSGAVGPLLSLKIKIEGGEVDAMVDTGSQSIVISHSMLHKIGKYLRFQGKDFPTLNRPHLHLYGKGGKDGASQLNITAETILTTEADGHQVNTPVFVQPGSEQLFTWNKCHTSIEAQISHQIESHLMLKCPNLPKLQRFH